MIFLSPFLRHTIPESSPGVDTGVCDADGPGRVPYCHLHVGLVAGDVVPVERELDHLDQGVPDIVGHSLLADHAKQGLHVGPVQKLKKYLTTYSFLIFKILF